jgi:NO-binding membrane sensor protein with MHYT domain
MTAAQVVFVPAHDPWLIVLSVAISIFAAYVTLDFSERMGDARGRAWLAWLAGGAALDGLGIWSMHYTGMLALRLPAAVQFDGPMVLLSLLVAVAGSAGALLLVSRSDVGWLRAIAAAIVFGGIGVAGLHYTAMAGFRLPGYRDDRHRPALIAVAVAGAARPGQSGVALHGDGRGHVPLHRLCPR